MPKRDSVLAQLGLNVRKQREKYFYIPNLFKHRDSEFRQIIVRRIVVT
jgi:hypothetical protein